MSQKIIVTFEDIDTLVGRQQVVNVSIQDEGYTKPYEAGVVRWTWGKGNGPVTWGARINDDALVDIEGPAKDVWEGVKAIVACYNACSVETFDDLGATGAGDALDAAMKEFGGKDV